MNISRNNVHPAQLPETVVPPVLLLGFRPFFLGASGLAVISMALWLGLLAFQLPLSFSRVPPSLWHAHELIYGYAVAVIAGFLLTAVRNWTGIETPAGWKLLALFLLWAAARIALFLGDALIAVAAAADLTFITALSMSVVTPIMKSKQWRQLAILSKLALLGAGNVLFYAGVLGLLDQGARLGVYTGLYLVIGLILAMGRRVIPGFIERGVGYPVTLANRRWLDLSSMALFVAFFVLDTFTQWKWVAGWCALALFLLHCIRAVDWHTPGMWRKPLLWSLYGAYLLTLSGFGLYAVSIFTGFVSYSIAIHAFTVGGIGLVTISMMSRVALGHTGRDVGSPPMSLTWIFALIVLAFMVRVLVPELAGQYYPAWVVVSGVLWISGFTLFLYIYLPVLTRPRVDGLPG